MSWLAIATSRTHRRWRRGRARSPRPPPFSSPEPKTTSDSPIVLMRCRTRRGFLSPVAVVSFLLLALSSLSSARAFESAAPPRDVLGRQSQALVEQDLAVALESLGRSEEAVRH